MVNPIAGVVTSEFNPRRVHPITGKVTQHWGIDIASRGDRRIVAAYGGVVERVGYGDFPYRSGRYVFIRNTDGEAQLYGHIAQAHVKVGQRVKAGDLIATEGATGNVTGAHSYFELHNKGSNKSNGYSRVRNPRLDFRAAGITPGVNKVGQTSSSKPGKVIVSKNTKKIIHDLSLILTRVTKANNRTASQGTTRHATAKQ